MSFPCMVPLCMRVKEPFRPLTVPVTVSSATYAMEPFTGVSAPSMTPLLSPVMSPLKTLSSEYRPNPLSAGSAAAGFTFTSNVPRATCMTGDPFA